MSKYEHTPAPWNVARNTSTRVVKNTRTIANTNCQNNNEKEFFQNQANAQLIAAAPDMLREMEALAQALEDTGHDAPQSFFDAINKARGVE